jgi:flavin reductase (DIM6/NTAB) family NADH-FMN oxidoreductase RutF
MFYEPGQHGAAGLPHDPFKAIVAPRPIGWLSTIDRDGVVNLAPYSFFNALAADPPVLVVGAGCRGDGRPKDSQVNIVQTGEFVHNVVTAAQREVMNETSLGLPHGESEMARTGLEGVPSVNVVPPRVKGAPIHLECRYLQTVELPCRAEGRRNWAILGEVVGIHIDESVLVDGLVDVTLFEPVARLGYFDYTKVSDVFSMRRPG